MSARQQLRLAALAFFVVAGSPAVGCNKGSAPKILDPGNQVAVVGQTLTVNIFASDPDGDDLTFSFAAAGIEDVSSTANLSLAPAGHAVFQITPKASQVGDHIVDFIVSDGTFDTTLSVPFEIRGAVGNGSAPIFRKPLSQGTVLDLEASDCTDIEIEIDDPDSTQVALTQVPPTIDGAQLDAAANGLQGTWSWCPGRHQVEAHTQYELELSADDGDNAPTLKDFLVVLRRRSGADCPGEPPVIEHEPSDFSTLLDLPIAARVSDDIGLKNPPLVLYTFDDPGSEIPFDKLQVAAMTLIDGDMMDGTWQAHITNPTAPMGEGAAATLWYIVEATDNDDIEGDCDHRVDAPADGMFEVSVVNGGGATASICEPCSFDVQCGGDSDLCLTRMGGSFCGTGCDGTGGCGSGYTCSSEPVQSVEGRSERQCVPEAGTCADAATGSCQNDAHENDDTPAQAIEAGAIAPGSYTATLCSGDQDWWLIDVPSTSSVVATLAGTSPPDMDLQLANLDGVLLDQSVSISSDELIHSVCLEPGGYLLRAYIGAGSGFGDYTLSYELDTGSCGDGPGQGDCCIDNNSPGCEDPDTQSCVCGMDSYCCDNKWDGICAGIAKNSCGHDCGGDTEPMDEDCCTAQQTPGCTDDAIEACVCADDPFCCGQDDAGTGTWDVVCVGKVGSLLCAPSCDPDDADGPCCEANGTAGCEVNTVEQCVCAEGNDPDCCNDVPGWDILCVDGIETFGCGTCP